jgi:hypothetical protein
MKMDRAERIDLHFRMDLRQTIIRLNGYPEDFAAIWRSLKNYYSISFVNFCGARM